MYAQNNYNINLQVYMNKLQIYHNKRNDSEDKIEKKWQVNGNLVYSVQEGYTWNMKTTIFN